MNVTEYYNLGRDFSEALIKNGEVELGEKLASILDNENEESPAHWIPKAQKLAQDIYNKSNKSNYSNELLLLLQAGAQLEAPRNNKVILFVLITALTVGIYVGSTL